MASVRKMPANPGPAGWNCILPARIPEPALDQQLQADYLIIGAGFAGLSAARRLIQLQPDATIIILEGCTVAEGPAGRNSGFMIDLPHDLASSDYAGDSAEHDRRQTALNRAAIQFARDAVAEYALPDEALVACGKINAAATAKGMAHNRDYAAHLQQLGEDYRLLDATDMQLLTGIDYYQGGLWTPSTVMLQPALYIRGLAKGLLRHPRLSLYEHSPVVALNKSNQSPAYPAQNRQPGWLAQTANGSVQAGKVILAVNGLVQHFGYYPRQLMHIFTYASMTRALTPAETKALGGEAHWAFTPADPLGTTVRRISGTGGERIIIRNRATYDPSAAVTDSRMDNISHTHRRSFEARFPMLKQVEMEYCWGGRLCLSRNGVAALGELEDGLYSANCQNGLGTAKGTIAGIISAELACGSTETLLPDYQPEVQPSRLLPEPFMSLGANAYLRWKEFRAGREL